MSCVKMEMHFIDTLEKDSYSESIYKFLFF